MAIEKYPKTNCLFFLKSKILKLWIDSYILEDSWKLMKCSDANFFWIPHGELIWIGTSCQICKMIVILWWCIVCVYIRYQMLHFLQRHLVESRYLKKINCFALFLVSPKPFCYPVIFTNWFWDIVIASFTGDWRRKCIALL